MNITIVSFKAFSHDMQEAYMNKTLGQIHRDLKDKCETYHPTKIQIVEFEEKDLKEVSVDQLVLHKESWEKVFIGMAPEKMGQIEYVMEYMKKNFDPPKKR
jgi:hypothetical protein